MPSNRKPKINLSYTCEWETCDSVFNNIIDDLIDHVNDHLNAYYSMLQLQGTQLRDEVTFNCQWRGCDMTITGAIGDYNRHIQFHVFHTKIKEHGRGVMEKKSQPIGECALDERSRNLIPELPEKLCCDWQDCDVSYDNAEYFYRHVNQHATDEPDLACLWEGCGIPQSSRYRLKEHLRSHTQEKLVACPKCGSLFSCHTKFLDHLRKQGHPDGMRYQCSHCSKSFATERLLRDHMRRHVNNYKCEFCDMTSPTPSGIKAHVKYRHSDDRPFHCSHCPHRCKTLTDLTRHVTSYHEESFKYRCNIADCTYSTKTVESLKEHLHSHEGSAMRYACHVCDKKFARGSQLTKHLKFQHKYKWPSGHRRFRYTAHSDGLLRLQTLRYENVELVEHIAQSDDLGPDDVDPDDDGGSDNVVPDGAGTDDSLSKHLYNNLAMLVDVACEGGDDSDDALIECDE